MCPFFYGSFDFHVEDCLIYVLSCWLSRSIALIEWIGRLLFGQIVLYAKNLYYLWYLLNSIDLLLWCVSSSSGETELTDTAYDILKVLGKDADFITIMIQSRPISETRKKPIKQK